MPDRDFETAVFGITDVFVSGDGRAADRPSDEQLYEQALGQHAKKVAGETGGEISADDVVCGAIMREAFPSAVSTSRQLDLEKKMESVTNG